MSSGETMRKSAWRKKQPATVGIPASAATELALPDRAPRFLISRMSAIGDTILTLPVARALRARFPDAHIAWIVEEKSSPVVRGHRAVDELIVLERGWFTSPRGLRE